MNLSSCSDKTGPELSELKADQVASWAPPGATLARTREDNAAAGGAASKQQLARVLRIFTFADAAAAAAAVRTTTDEALANGWTLRHPSITTGAVLERPCQQSTCTLAISVGPGEDELGIELTRTI